MGMAIGIEVRDDVPPDVVAEAFASFRDVDRLFSPYRADSEISRIARRALSMDQAAGEVQEVLAGCERLRKLTNGFFDPLASGQLDPSGFVKGWAVDRVAEILQRGGAVRFAINAGGDVLLRGGEPWRVGIQHPMHRHLLAAVVERCDAAIATSGTYERGNHIINPHTGQAPHGLLSVTMVGPDLATVDACATAAFAMGAAAPHWMASLEGYEGMAILDEERVVCTRGFLDFCPGGSPAASLRPAGERAFATS